LQMQVGYHTDTAPICRRVDHMSGRDIRHVRDVVA
jgi:hypothetical protein